MATKQRSTLAKHWACGAGHYRIRGGPMPEKKPEQIVLPLRDLHDLFAAPEFDPFAETFSSDRAATDALEDTRSEVEELYEPGLDYLLSRLRGSRLARRGRLVLRLPPGKLEPDLEGQVRRAIVRYCRHQILDTKRTLNELLWTGLKALQVGVLFLTVCLVLAAAIARWNAAPGSLGDFLTQGLTIVGWVSLWRPVEIFLYEWWPLWRAVRVYDYIARMDITIQAWR